MIEAGAGTPLLDFFKRGEVDRDIRLMAAQGLLGLRPHEQVAMLEFLANDPDPEVAQTAAAGLRDPGPPAAGEETEPAQHAAGGEDEEAEERSALQKIASMTPAQRLALAMKGTREERAILVRDPNKIVAVAVLSSPKITESEVAAIAKMANVQEDILRIIGQTRRWMKSYTITAALTKNAKTPVALSLNLLARLHDADVKVLAADRNIPDVVRRAAQKRLSAGRT